jgi:hypothetical protein
MSVFTGLDGKSVPGLEDLQHAQPDRIVQALEERGLLDTTASAVLRQYLRYRILAFVLHPVRCTMAPAIFRDCAVAAPQGFWWTQAGTIFVFAQMGVWGEHKGAPLLRPAARNETPDAVILHFCFAA